MEAALVTVLRSVTPNVYPDIAPAGAVMPYITYQHIGGTPQRFVEGAAATLRHSMVQINTWAATRAQALQLIRAVEDALCAATTITARPEGEPIGDVDEDLDRRGCLQDFSIWSPRT